jgi:hypothetical protein
MRTPVVTSRLKIALWAHLSLESAHPLIAQSPVALAASRKAKRNKPAQSPSNEIAKTQASQEQTFPMWLLIALLRSVGS